MTSSLPCRRTTWRPGSDQYRTELTRFSGGWANPAHRTHPAQRGRDPLMAFPRPVSTPDTVPVGPLLSMFDPVYLGIDEAGEPVYLPMMYNNLLVGGIPGSGKSVTLHLIVAHGGLSTDCRLCLIDGKQVELGMWKDVADVFVGPNIDHAIDTLRRIQAVMDNRYAYLMAQNRRKIERGDAMNALLVVVDEIAYFSATVGDKNQRDTFSALLRDIVARGRAVAVIVVGATQR